MPKRSTAVGDSRIILGKLDELILKCYEGLILNIKDNAKIGDFIKMFEMRMKYTPTDGERTKFWAMLEEVRQDSLPSVQRTTKKKKAGKSRGKEKT